MMRAIVLTLLVFLGLEALVAGSTELRTAPCSPEPLPYGIALAPPIYLINFLLLYFANPSVAAFMREDNESGGCDSILTLVTSHMRLPFFSALRCFGAD